MRFRFLLLPALAAMFLGCSECTDEKAIIIANSGDVNAETIEAIRAFAERELKVTVHVRTAAKLAGAADIQSAQKTAERLKKCGDAIFIAITSIPENADHLTVSAENRTAIVNVAPLQTDDAQKFERRVERQVMRAAAFAVGLPPTPDPYCVTRDYSSLEDLDRMGRNYSPPWQGRFADEAAKLGLTAPKPECLDGVCPIKK